MILQEERVERGEIRVSTMSNYYKPVKTFCEMNGIILSWKRINRGRNVANDRAPTLEEIRK
jgi:hypothetical protein